MNRLQKKCIIASAAMHGLLLCVILFGSAFFVRKDNVDNSFHQITVYRDVTDGPTIGNAAPSIPAPAQPQQPPQQPQVKPPTQPKTEPAKVEPPKHIETPKVADNKREKVLDSKDLQPVKKPSNNKVSNFSLNEPKKRNVLDGASLTRVTHKAPKKQIKAPKDNQDDEADTQYRAEVAKRAAAAKELASALKSINRGLSSSTIVSSPPGNDAGVFAANYNDVIASIYYSAWTAPSDVSAGTPTVQVSVTVSRDGSVITAHITRRSGVSAMDRSIESLINSVKYIEAFPEGTKDQQRTFKITFNLEAKRQLG